MRLVNLRPWPDGPEIELHPRITLIVGLLPFERVELVSTAHSIAIGEVPVWDGCLEVEGVQMSFVESAEVLGPQAECAPVVTTDEIANLAGHPSLHGQPSEPRTEGDPMSVIREHLAEIADELSGAAKLRSEMQGRLASANANVDPQVFDELSRADGILKRSADLANRPDQWTGAADPAARLERISQMLALAESKLAELPVGDRVELARATAVLRVALSTGDMPLPEAVGLGERLNVLEERWADIVAQFRSLGFDRDGATARLESAQAALRAAEQAATPREVTSEETSEVERLHELCLEFHDKVDGGIRRGSARRRLDVAQSELDRVLDSIGYTTWSQFRMGNGMVTVTDEALKAFAIARAELDATELEWAELRTMLETDPALVEIEEEISSVRRAAVHLLGQDPGGTNLSNRGSRLSKALAGVLVDAASSSIDVDDAEQQLQAALMACGTSAHTRISSKRGLLALGESWLSVLRSSDPARLLLARLRDRLRAETDALEHLGNTSRLDRLDAQRRAVAEVENRVMSSIESMLDVVHARIELHVLATTELAMAEEHDAGVELLEKSDSSSAQMTAGSISRADRDPELPIVVIFGNDDTSLLDPLVALSERLQIIVVGDGEALIAWAGRVGPEGASVVDRGVLV